MARPLRLEFARAIYHDDEDRESFLSILAEVVDTFNWLCHGYCLMSNHYHLVIETPDSNLSKGMRQLNGVYTQSSNRRHNRVGHLFQGRYKAILVDADAYLLELTRYVVLNPVRAGMVNHSGQRPWSSYLAMVGQSIRPSWLAVDGLLAQFSSQRHDAVRRYEEFVTQGVGIPSIWSGLKGQIFLGDEAFVTRMQAMDEGLYLLIAITIGRMRCHDDLVTTF